MLGVYGLTLAGAQMPLNAQAASTAPSDAITVHIVDLYGKAVSNVVLKPDYLIPDAVASTASSQTVKIPINSASPKFPRKPETTDSNGDAVFPGFPSGYTLFLAVSDDRFAQFSSEKHVHLRLRADSNTVTLIVSPGGEIEGDVKYAGSGLPAAGLRVVAVDTVVDSGIEAAVGTTDVHGHYKITQLIPDTYNIELDVTQPAAAKWSAAAREQLAVPAAVSLKGIDLTLAPGSTINGKVTDRETNRPIPGQIISIFGPAHPMGSGWPGQVTSRPDGSFSVSVPPGKQTLVVPPESAGEAAVFQSVDAVDGQTETVSIKAPSPDAWRTVVGKVIGVDGKPVAAAAVSNLATGASVTSGKDGSFHFILDSLKETARLCGLKDNLATLNPVPAKCGDHLVLQVVPRVVGSILGAVKDDHNSPIVYAYVNLEREGKTVGIAKTDMTGSYNFDGLVPNVGYSVAVDERGYYTTNQAGGTLKPGQNLVMPTLIIKKIINAVPKSDVHDTAL
jgi:hypothetical protein